MYCIRENKENILLPMPDIGWFRQNGRTKETLSLCTKIHMKQTGNAKKKKEKKKKKKREKRKILYLGKININSLSPLPEIGSVSMKDKRKQIHLLSVLFKRMKKHCLVENRVLLSNKSPYINLLSCMQTNALQYNESTSLSGMPKHY